MFKLLAATATLALVGIAAPAMAQSSASADGTGSITVIRPIQVANTANLAFGTVIRPATGSGSVTISPAGVPSVTGVTLAPTSGARNAAAFTVTGEGGQAVSVTVPATFSMTGPASSTLLVTTANTVSSPTLSNALGASGTLQVLVGGTVPIEASTTTGAYSGTFTVSAAYN